MPISLSGEESPEKAAEYLRLTIARLRELEWPVTAVNYSLIYYYMVGEFAALNQELDSLISRNAPLTSELAEKLFTEHICKCKEALTENLQTELLNTLTQIMGSIVDLAGRTRLSNKSLEKHIELLASTSQPSDILKIASDIISETRDLLDATSVFEESLRSTSDEIENLKGELNEARHQAYIDALTGLKNRRGFDQALEETITDSIANNQNFCLLLIDIDHFKDVNDTHGHLVGDKVLRGISKLLINQMRGNDHLSRYGGEEFAVILPNTPMNGAHIVAENLRVSAEKLRLKHVKTGKSITNVTISTGVAAYRKGESIEQFIHRCDKALYRAKHLGRNRTVVAE